MVSRTVRTLVDFFKALADPNRQRILRVLRDGECCVSDIRKALGNLSQPSVSHHLGVLRQAGLVDSRREGKEVHYSINTPNLAECCTEFFKPFGISVSESDDQ